jgi:hypothetical protein
MSGWEVTVIVYYHNVVDRPVAGTFKQRASMHAANLMRRALRVSNGILPYWGDGMIVWARRIDRPAPRTGIAEPAVPVASTR